MKLHGLTAVELHLKNPRFFIVSYTGEHPVPPTPFLPIRIHPRAYARG